MADLCLESICKSFLGVRALVDVSFSVQAGSIHALCGENGAGKSTLLKILSGAYQQDSGTIRIDGHVAAIRNPQDAFASGIAVIYQELHLLPELSIAENMFLGNLPRQGVLLDRRTLERETVKQLERVKLDIDPHTAVGQLSIAQRQMVEIAKALSRNARMIAFDEPTSSLSMREVEQLFMLIRELKEQRKAILYVSHRMNEIFELCDSATVLRDGRHVESFAEISLINQDVLVNRMVGREIQDIFAYRPRPIGDIVLESTVEWGGGEPVSLQVRQGEIVGIFGLVGAGRSELLKSIIRTQPNSRADTSIRAMHRKLRSPRDAVRAGLALCPEDRKKEAIFPVLSVQENINVSARRNMTVAGFIASSSKERNNATRKYAELGIRAVGLDQPIRELSGGNQQKTILARWLSENIEVLLLDEPTRGIDVGAKQEIYSILYDLAEAGKSIILVSSELPEVLGVCDRILVMREGQIVADLPRQEATPEGVLRLALNSI